MCYKNILLISLFAATTLLIGCDKLGKIEEAVKTANSAVANSGDNQNEMAKFNAYVEAHNSLTHMFYGSHQGMKNLIEAYQAQHLSGKIHLETSEPLLYLNTSKLRNSLKALKEAQAIKADAKSEKLHAIGARMLANGDALFSQATELEGYFKSKKYLEDKYAKVKAEDADFIKKWTQFIEDSYALSDEISGLERANLLAQAADEKNNGNFRRAAKVEIILYESDILALFTQRSDFKNKEKFKTADALIVKLEQTIVEFNTAKNKTADAFADSSSNTSYDYMNKFVGAYRTLKIKGDTYSYQEMVDYYNSILR
jgi:Protein of unknown function (DUF3829)